MSTLNIVEVMKAESAISGVIAGVAFTGVALLAERVSVKKGTSNTQQDSLGEGAIAMFIMAFVVGLAAAYLFAVGTSQDNNDPRTLVIFLFPAFLFTITIYLMVLGLILLCEFFDLTYTIDAIRGFQFLILIFSISEFSSSTIDAVANGNASVFNNYYYWGLVVIGGGCVLVAYLARKIVRRNSRQPFSRRGLRGYMLVVLFTSILVGFCMSYVLDLDETFQLPQWSGIVLVLILAALGGWAALHVPQYQRIAKKTDRE